MARQNQFKVDAESVQGNEGAWVEFRALTVGEYRELVTDGEKGDLYLVTEHLVDWGGFTDTNGNDLPSIKDEPGVFDILYWHEMQTLSELLLQGPVDRKN